MREWISVALENNRPNSDPPPRSLGPDNHPLQRPARSRELTSTPDEAAFNLGQAGHWHNARVWALDQASTRRPRHELLSQQSKPWFRWIKAARKSRNVSPAGRRAAVISFVVRSSGQENCKNSRSTSARPNSASKNCNFSPVGGGLGSSLILAYYLNAEGDCFLDLGGRNGEGQPCVRPEIDSISIRNFRKERL